MIISFIIFSPVASDMPHAAGDYGETIVNMNAGVLGWLLTQWGSMGFMGGNLSEQLDYVNRNGALDEYLTQVLADYQTYIDEIAGSQSTVYKMQADYWEKLFNGDPANGIIGAKEMYVGSTDPQSDYYLSLEELTLFNGTNYLIKEGYYSNVVTHLTSTLTSELFNKYAISESTQYSTYDSHDVRWYKTFNGTSHYMRRQQVNPLGSDSLIWEIYGPTALVKFVPVMSWINSDGSLTNGAKYKARLVPIYFDGTFFGETMTDSKVLVDSAVATSEIQYITPNSSITFDADVLDQELGPEDITAEDYVLYEIDRQLIEQIQELQMKISMNEDTAEDWIIDEPQVIRVETTNTVIREIIQANDAVIPAEIDWPETQQWEVPNLVTTRFPFSIPWDLKRAFEMMAEEPEVPSFELPFVIESLNIDLSMTIDLSQFEPLARICRWFFMALFLLGLILSTRSLIKG